MTRPAALRRIAATAATLTFAALAVVACDDKPKHPTAPEGAAPQATVAETPGLQAAAGGVSTVCLSYMNKVSVAQEKLAELKAKRTIGPMREVLEKKVEKLEAMAKDACE